jgi:hypothetical protein
VIFFRTRDVGLGGEDFEVLAGECGVWNSEEGGIPLGLLREVTEAEDLRRGLCGALGERSGGGEGKNQGEGCRT